MILSHNQKNKDMKEGDLILVSAEATGLGKPMEAIIDKIETFMGQTLEQSLTRNQTPYPASEGALWILISL